MLEPATPDNEEERIHALYQLQLLDTTAESAFDKVTKLAKKIFNVPIVAVSLVDKDRQWFKSIQGLDVKETPRSISFCGHTILTEEPLIVENAKQDDRFHNNPLVTQQPNIMFYAGCPISTIDGNQIGTLCIIDQKPRKISEHEIDCLKDLTSIIEEEVNNRFLLFQNNKLLNEISELKKIITVDSLTNTLNRKGIEKCFDFLVEKSNRTNKKFTLGIIDVDFFKAVNDNYGHNAGDFILKEVSQRLLACVRKIDFVGRWAGDEFIILLDYLDMGILNGILARIKNSINNTPFQYNNHCIQCSITIGAAYYTPNSNISLEKLVNQADTCLYEGKSLGKNRFVISS